MNATAIKTYGERLETIIESIAFECETITAADELSSYQASELKGLKQLYQDLINIKRVDDFFNN